MSDQTANNRALSLALVLLFLGMLASTGFQPENRGELGDEDRPMETHSALNFPGSTVGSIHSLTAIGAAYNYTCVVMDNNQMKCWGDGASGKTGHENTDDYGDEEEEMGQYLMFTDVGPGLTFTDVAAGDDFTCALLSDASVKCWGSNASGQLGLGDTNSR